MRVFYLFVAILLIALHSCALSTYTYDLDRKMRSMELGLDKPSVIALLGSNYKVTSAVNLDENNREEVWRYEGDSNGIYDLMFKNGRIVEWVFITPPVPLKTETEVTIKK